MRSFFFVCFLLGNSPASEFYMPTFRNTLFHLRRQVGVNTYLPMKMEQSVLKRQHIKFRHWGITQKKHTTFRTWRKFEIEEIFVGSWRQNVYFLPTVHLSIILVNKQLYAQFFFVYVCFNSLHVLSAHVLLIRRISCINTSGICHCM